MGWSAATVWWIVAGVLVAIELASGTFYSICALAPSPLRRDRCHRGAECQPRCAA